jgi:hypothetical protein
LAVDSYPLWFGVSEMASDFDQPILICCICGQLCALEDCNTDERGMPVHEKCYSAYLTAEKGARPRQQSPPTASESASYLVSAAGIEPAITRHATHH